MALFENFPYTNLHELNLDWLINVIKKIEETTVISVNGQTGEVILYQDATMQLPDVTADHWSIIRMADGTYRGIMFGNDDKAYIVHGNTLSQIYSANNPPPYPVTSVNGQTGAIELYTSAYVALPDLTDAELHNWNIYRALNNVIRGIQFSDNGKAYLIAGNQRYEFYSSNNEPPYPVTSVEGQTGAVQLYQDPSVKYPDVAGADLHSWNIWRNLNNNASGIQFNDDGTVSLIVGSNRYTLYSSNNPPSYPVTSVNGQTGTVLLNIPQAFVNNPAAAELTIAENILDSSVWALIRETDNGYVGIAVDSTTGSQAAYLQIGTGAGKQLVKLLTLADIPQSSGVVSINGLSGVVVLSGADLNVSTTDTRKINVVLAGLESDVSALQDMDDYIREALVFDEQGQTTATHNIPAGSFVYWNNGTYTASQAISIGDTLSSTNLTAVPAGGAINAINSNIKTSSITITLNQNISWEPNTSIVAYRIGNIVIVTGVIHVPSSGLNSNDVIANINSPLPNHKYWFPINESQYASRGAITTTGSIIAEESIASGYAVFNFSYAI